MDEKKLEFVRLLVTGVSVAATLLLTALNEKQQKIKIDNSVREAVAEHIAEIKNN